MNSKKNPKTVIEKEVKPQKQIPRQFSLNDPGTKQLSRSPTKKPDRKQSNTISSIKNSLSSHKNEKAPPKNQQMSTISKENYDIMDSKINITDIKELEVKYCLKCTDGIYKNRFLYITTHKQGQIFGSGDAKQFGLTLQVDGAGLEKKHCKLKYSGIGKFYVKDYGTKTGTWVNIGSDGIRIKHGQVYIIGPFKIRFEIGQPVDQIQQLCMINNCNYLCDKLKYNKIESISELLAADYNDFKGYPFSEEEIKKLKQLSLESKTWFDESEKYHRLQAFFINEQLQLAGFSLEIGWETYSFPAEKQMLLQHNSEINKLESSIAFVRKGRMFPPLKKLGNSQNTIFTELPHDKYHRLGLHDQIKIGNLLFELTRFNYGADENIGFRDTMEDCLVVEEDVGGSEWKLISLFAVFDGYGGSQCIKYIKKNLVGKIRQWTHLLDEAGDLNQMINLLMFKTFYEIDFDFSQEYPELALTCGATGLLVLIIDSKAYCFNLGDNKGIIYRKDQVFQLSVDHLPSRIDEKARIQAQGGFVQYDRMMGKCTISRAFGQFQYKKIQDYQKGMKGKLKSYLSCQPDVVCFDLDPNIDDFIFISTDGLFDALGMKVIVNYITQKTLRLDDDENPSKIVNSLMENAKVINSKDCDNMAAILIYIGKGKIGPKTAW